MITGKKLFSLLPQTSPMLMIDALVSSDQEKTITNLTISEENIFCINGKFREPGIIENMAQTAAVRSGFNAKNNNEKLKTGYIGTVKNLNIYFLPNRNQIITTKLFLKTEIGNISVIAASVTCQNQLIAECEMTIILLDDE